MGKNSTRGLGAPDNLRGIEIINNPLYNKGSGFTMEERDKYGLGGLLPPYASTMQIQCDRVIRNIRGFARSMNKYIALESLHNRNETLYYRVLIDNITELTPIVYTPTVGQACQDFGHIFHRSRGMYFSVEHRGKFRKMMDNWHFDEMDVIVVTDGSRILGLGDLGASGMGIPIGKLSLYVACAGIHPHRVLPVTLDVGTNNEKLLNDELYLGHKAPRITGDEYDEMIDEFVKAAFDRWPNVLLQFEDFTNDHAFDILERYRHDNLCFNDDIQGTGSVALAGVFASLRITKKTLADQRIVFYGAGSAGVGIANTIVDAMVDEGMTVEEARSKFWFLDSRGLVSTRRDDVLAPHKVPFARDEEPMDSLLEVIKKVKPTILMGLSGQPQTFTKEVVQEMHKHQKEPVIFALSNPTSKAECTAEQAYLWTNGAAIFASGSPFDPIVVKGKTHIPGQGNNMYIFPGVGLGAVLCLAKNIPDAIFAEAARVLANLVPQDLLDKGDLYPPITDIREISKEIAIAVIEMAFERGLARIERPADIRAFVEENMYVPEYSY